MKLTFTITPLSVVLFLILITVMTNMAYTLHHARQWETTKSVVVIPFPADADDLETKRYIDKLDGAYFKPVVDFFDRETRRYGLANHRPYRFRWQRVARASPPMLRNDAGMAATVWYSWSMRVYTWYIRVTQHIADHVIVYAMFRQTRKHTADSTGLVEEYASKSLDKFSVCFINLSTDRGLQVKDRFVLAHELLHLSGATDKYDVATGEPSFPQGYADPEKQPLYPQTTGLLMAMAIPFSPEYSALPKTMQEISIGALTAKEINWLH